MNCKICESNNTRVALSLKNLPISNDYNKANKSKHISNYKIYLCRKCDLVQVKKNFNLNHLVPKNKKLKQNEPEEHLDGLVKKILNKKILNKQSNILCLSYKDQSLSDRFKAKGFKNIEMLNYKKFFKSNNVFFENLENFNKKKYFKNKNKKYDLVIGRHIVEHFFDPKQFILNLKNLLNPKNGFVYLEIPDSLKSMSKFDYNMLWEQHKMYFTKNTLQNLMTKCNFKTIFNDIYKYKYENCVLYLGNLQNKKLNPFIFKNEYKILIEYFSKIKKIKKNLISHFEKLSKKGNLLIYGAGHQTIMFLHLFNLEKFIKFVVDDNKLYIKRFLPGTNLKIEKKNSSIKFKYCFISANFENEKKIIKNNRFFLRNKKILSLSFFDRIKGSGKHL